MKTLIIVIAIVSAACADAATTINAVNRFAYGAYIGWINWQGDVANGAVIGAIVSNNIKFQAKFSFFKQASQLDKHRIHPTRNARPIAPRPRKIQRISDKRQKCLKN